MPGLLDRCERLGVPVLLMIDDNWIAAGRDIACATGETIFQDNTPGAWAYLVREGRVRILRESGGRELTLGMLGVGDVFDSITRDAHG